MALNLITRGGMPMLQREGKIVGNLQKMSSGIVNILCPMCGSHGRRGYSSKEMFTQHVDYMSLSSAPEPGSKGNVLLIMVCNEDRAPFARRHVTVEEKLFEMKTMVVSMMMGVGYTKWPYSNIIMITSMDMGTFTLLQAWEKKPGSEPTEMSPDKAPF